MQELPFLQKVNWFSFMKIAVSWFEFPGNMFPSLAISQLWSRYWLGAIRQQAIMWTILVKIYDFICDRYGELLPSLGQILACRLICTKSSELGLIYHRQLKPQRMVCHRDSANVQRLSWKNIHWKLWLPSSPHISYGRDKYRAPAVDEDDTDNDDNNGDDDDGCD